MSDSLKIRLDKLTNTEEKIMVRRLSDQQKHNLHLLLKASLKGQNPTEIVQQLGIEPGLFTDIFLRDDINRVVWYEDLEKFSPLCCRVIKSRADQLPEIDSSQTYAGQTELLFHDLSECNSTTVS